MVKKQIIEAFINLAQSLGWPTRWLKGLDSNEHILIWLGLTYTAFLLGMKVALHVFAKRQAKK